MTIINSRLEGKTILISGLYGLGKTTLAMTLEDPALTAMIDFDLKGRATANELGIWYKSPEASEADFKVEDLAPWFLKVIKEIPEGKTHLIIDNATWAEDGLGWWVKQKPEKYGVNPINAKTGAYGGVNPGITKLWASILTYLQSRGIQVVTAINHMSQPWVNGVPVPNRFNIKGNKFFQQTASLVLILVAADSKRGGRMDKTPSAIVVKENLGSLRFDNGEFIVKSTLPPRLPIANWKVINNYIVNPIDKPGPGEVWNKSEQEAYSEWLSPEQIQWVMKVSSYTEEVPTESHMPEQSKVQSRPEPQKSNGNPKSSRQPFEPSRLLEELSKLVKNSKLVDKETGDPLPINLLHKDAAKYVASHWTKALDGDKDKYHLSLQGTFARESANELNAPEANAVLTWLLGKEYQLGFDAPIVEPASQEAIALYEYFAEVAGENDIPT